MVLIGSIGSASAVHAQVARAPTGAPAVPSADSQRVAVVIFAEASAGSIAFAKQPRIEVRLDGQLDSMRVLERRNLPTPVVAGRTYRDVYVSVEIMGHMNADCIARTLTGRRDSVAGASAGASGASGASGACASLELRGATTRPAAPSRDTTSHPRN